LVEFISLARDSTMQDISLQAAMVEEVMDIKTLLVSLNDILMVSRQWARGLVDHRDD
jgi:hypothetical protein